MSVAAKLNKEVILQTLASHKKELTGFGVKKIGLFGSFISDANTSENDIDLLVEIRKEKKRLKISWPFPFFWKTSLTRR